MKNNNVKYILSGIMSLLIIFTCFAQTNIVVSGANISPAPAVFPNGGQETFQFTTYLEGDPTSNTSVRIQVSLSNLDFTNSTFNVNTDIVQTGPTAFTWTYNGATKTLIATLAGSYESSDASTTNYNTIQIKNLNVLASNSAASANTGANVSNITPATFNSNINDDNTSAVTYTTTVLPIELLLFEASKLNDCESKLKWLSGEESYFDYYQLEQSTDSKSFREVGDLQKSKGVNSTYEQMADLKSAQSNSVYYRLKMVDLDRSVKYSKIVSVQNDCAKKNNISVTPNPANSTITIKGLNNKGSLYIYDMTGRLWLTSVLTELGNQPVNIEHLVQGTYMIQVRSEQGTYNSKLIKQ